MLTRATSLCKAVRVTAVNIRENTVTKGQPERRGLVLGAVCLAAFAINIDTTVVNVALPSLTRELGASTRDLQWIVDGYNLAFAALVLAAGSLGDRYGRRPALLTGLIGFALASAAGALCNTPGELIAARFTMGAFAALIFPTTLSVITNTFTKRAERAKAVGVWGAVTGLGVAAGPVTGGLLLAHFRWPSVFIGLVPVALLAALAVWRVVPESRDPGTPPIDRPGLVSATVTIGSLVYTIIEAPGRGWLSAASLAGFALAVVALIAFVVIERRARHPMLDLTLFRHRAFSAASASVTVAFFALFGFIFLITQYMQFVRGWSSLSTGSRILPVAISIAVSSVLGTALASRLGTRRVVVPGLLLLGSAFLWISQSGAFVSYGVIVGQMILMGSGLGLTTAPATESILSVLPPAKAGVGSAVNDATREAGGTLGVAVVGSIYTSLYAARLLHWGQTVLPHSALHLAQTSVGAGYEVATRAPAPVHRAVLSHVQSAFMVGLHTGCLVVGGVCLVGALGALALPGRNHRAPSIAEPAEPSLA
jgi:EmrB/QacA subfamily drug resistance transporter